MLERYTLVNIWTLRIGFLIAILGGIVAVGFALYAKGAAEEREKIALADAKVAQEQYDKQFKLSTELEKNLAQIRADNDKLKDDLDVEIAKNRAYRDCIVPVDGVRLYNAALAGATAAR
jgi:Tfp pilus assembly protein PilO